MFINNTITRPDELPFLAAICWDLRDISVLDCEQVLNRYERGWDYKGILADLGSKEKLFIQKLAKQKGSWLQFDV